MSLSIGFPHTAYADSRRTQTKNEIVQAAIDGLKPAIEYLQIGGLSNQVQYERAFSTLAESTIKLQERSSHYESTKHETRVKAANAVILGVAYQEPQWLTKAYIENLRDSINENSPAASLMKKMLANMAQNWDFAERYEAGEAYLGFKKSLDLPDTMKTTSPLGSYGFLRTEA